MVRELLQTILREQLGKQPQSVALSFSGGTDSTVLFFVLRDLGVLPTLYTYVVKGKDTPDLQRARYIHKAYGAPLVVCQIPTGEATIIRDVRSIIKDGIVGKVCIQCVHGHYYVAPQVKERVIFNGSGVDGLYGAYRTYAFDGSRKDKVIFDRSRAAHFSNPNDDAMVYQSGLFQKFGVQVMYPYRDARFVEWLMSKSWVEINRPRLKWIVVREFPEIVQAKGYYRPRGSQQIMAGTRALHDKLLASKINLGHRRVDEVYKDIVAGRV